MLTSGEWGSCLLLPLLSSLSLVVLSLGPDCERDLTLLYIKEVEKVEWKVARV
jgi:hypothetical protein